MKKIFEKREENECDEEALTISGELLAANPDVYTLWNIRRGIILAWKITKSTTELQKFFGNELHFLASCLRLNPKSYGTWHHRAWVLDIMPEADWKQELALCNTFLEYDERNFHCWDYRRSVVTKAKVSAEEEFEFTSNKITTNFSNYSSWHYRSKLLPSIYPDRSHPVSVQEEPLLEEFELVQNAFFTDPSDQSAWLYHRWLLGRKERHLSLEAICLSRFGNNILVVLSKPAKNLVDFTLEVAVDGAVNASLLPWRSPDDEYCEVWFTELEFPKNDRTDVAVTLKAGDTNCERRCCLDEGVPLIAWRQAYKPGSRFSNELSAATSSVLVTELESCQQLHDLEPDNKWTMLTIVSLMRAIDPLLHEADTWLYLDKLIATDPMRTCYYTDLKSKYAIENCVERLLPDATAIDLSGKALTSLSHVYQLVTLVTVDLSNNELAFLSADLKLLQCVRQLYLDDNRLQALDALAALPELETLSVKNNYISSIDSLKTLRSCKNLKKLNLTKNPVCEWKDQLTPLLLFSSDLCQITT